MRRSITLHRGSSTGHVVAHLGPYATACKWADNEHGNSALSVTVPRALTEAFRLYAATGDLWVVASAGGRPEWIGLLDEPALWVDDDSGVTVRALGRWAALDDLLYTSFGSSTRVDDWRPVTAQDRSLRFPERFNIDTNNRLFIGLKQGQSYTSSVLGSLGMQGPDGGVQPILGFTADVEHNLPSSTWRIRLQRLDGGYGGTLTTVQTITGTGSVATTSISQTWVAACDALMIELDYNSGTPTVYAGEDGASYVRLTNIRARITTTGVLYADTVATSMFTAYDTLNPGIITGTLLTSPGLDLTDLVLEDAAPTDVLAQLGLWGDGAGTVYTAAVDQDGFLTFKERGTGGRTWYVDVDDLELTAARGDLTNSVYAVYKEPSGRVLRTAASTDATSVTRYGRTRQRAVKADTTSVTIAGQIRDTALADSATVRGAASFTIRHCQAAGGGPADPAHIRPGDTLIVRNLPLLGGGPEVDQIRGFRVGERSYDPIKRQVSVSPEQRLPRLEVLLGQREVR